MLSLALLSHRNEQLPTSYYQKKYCETENETQNIAQYGRTAYSYTVFIIIGDHWHGACAEFYKSQKKYYCKGMLLIIIQSVLPKNFLQLSWSFELFKWNIFDFSWQLHACITSAVRNGETFSIVFGNFVIIYILQWWIIGIAWPCKC